MDILKKSDFPEVISAKLVEENFGPEQVESRLVENFEKGIIPEELFLSSMNVVDKLEKGKRGTIGEIRTWSGKKYQKTAEGWVPVKEGANPKESQKETTTENSKKSTNKIPSGEFEGDFYNSKGDKMNIRVYKDGGVKVEDANVRKDFDNKEDAWKFLTSRGYSNTEKENTERVRGSQSTSTETKVSDFGIAGKVGGGYRATGTINGKKMGVDIPADMIRGVANFEGKELRQKIKAHLAEKGEEIVTGRVSSGKHEFLRVQQDLNEKVNSLSLLTTDGWKESWSKNVRSKSYGDENFVKSMSVRAEGDFVKKETYFTVDCGYSKSPEFGEEANKYYSQLTSLREKKFSTAREAAKAADQFAKDWNKENNKLKEAIESKDKTKVLKVARKLSKEELKKLIDHHYQMASSGSGGGHSVLVNIFTKALEEKK